MTGRRALARTSRTPGRTQQINFFELDEERRLVDLPGYGYAKVSASLRRDWQPLIENYLNGRRSLAGLILTVDCRREPGELDAMLIDWCVHAGLPLHVLLTKADKLSRNAAAQARCAAGANFSVPASSRRCSSFPPCRVRVWRRRARSWPNGWNSGKKKSPSVERGRGSDWGELPGLGTCRATTPRAGNGTTGEKHDF